MRELAPPPSPSRIVDTMGFTPQPTSMRSETESDAGINDEREELLLPHKQTTLSLAVGRLLHKQVVLKVAEKAPWQVIIPATMQGAIVCSFSLRRLKHGAN